MRRAPVALCTLLCFGCTTVQAPAIPLGGPPLPPPPRVALAEPELELWMEGTGPIDPAESARALEESRAALAQALAGRSFHPGADADQILVVRSTAVARTAERKGKQTAAIIGSILLVVAVVAILVASSRGGHGRSGPGRVAAAPPRSGAPFPPVAGRPVPMARPLAPAPWPWWGFGLHVYVPLGPVGPAPGPWASAGPEPTTLAAQLPARGWFDGDEVELVIELRDRQTGVVILSRALRQRADPRDAREVGALLDELLRDQSWGGPQPVPEPTAPPSAPAATGPAPG